MKIDFENNFQNKFSPLVYSCNTHITCSYIKYLHLVCAVHVSAHFFLYELISLSRIYVQPITVFAVLLNNSVVRNEMWEVCHSRRPLNPPYRRIRRDNASTFGQKDRSFDQKYPPLPLWDKLKSNFNSVQRFTFQNGALWV